MMITSEEADVVLQRLRITERDAHAILSELIVLEGHSIAKRQVGT